MAVTNYTTLALALSAVSDINGDALTTGTDPTLAEAEFLQDRASLLVRLAFLREGLSDTPDSGSFAAELAITAETFLTSHFVLAAKSSLLEEQERAANLLRDLGRAITGWTDTEHVTRDGWVSGDIGSFRQVLLSNGASESLPVVDSQIANTSAAKFQDPTVVREVGAGGDYQYTAEPTFPQDDGAL